MHFFLRSASDSFPSLVQSAELSGIGSLQVCDIVRDILDELDSWKVCDIVRDILDELDSSKVCDIVCAIFRPHWFPDGEVLNIEGLGHPALGRSVVINAPLLVSS